MKSKIQNILTQALTSIFEKQQLSINIPEIKVERCKDKNHGDFATNIAMVLSKQLQTNPRDLATRIIAQIESLSLIQSLDIAGPGFINIRLNNENLFDHIATILEQGDTYGSNESGGGQRVQVEFVSANPTGPLHVGHGRGAAYGASLANVLRFSGYQVDTEYYVNDAGRQMDILATSVWLRYLQTHGVNITFPVNAYKGDYVLDIVNKVSIAKELAVVSVEDVLAGLPADEDKGGDKEQYIDAMIAKAKAILGEPIYQHFFTLAKNEILADIKDDLSDFGVTFTNWYSESSLMKKDNINKCINSLIKADVTYIEKDTLWFKSTRFGDDKDRVITRNNGQTTYFASDIAYHQEKFQRGYDILINIWGADHHGYIKRVKAAIKALDLPSETLHVLLVQFANLFRHGEKVQMSTRSGSFVTLRELREEVGSDAARFFYVMRKSEQHLDFDLDIATSKSSENPVYYIQYAHARICSVQRQLTDKGIVWDKENALSHLAKLEEELELDVISYLSQFPEVIESAGAKYEPHLLAHYLRELAHKMHAYYNKHQFIVDDIELCSARIALILAVKQVLSNGLRLLGISAPEAM